MEEPKALGNTEWVSDLFNAVIHQAVMDYRRLLINRHKLTKKGN